MEYLKEFGKNIKKRRLELGMTLEEVAKLTGYSGKSGVAKVESGYSNVYQDRVLAFAKALKTTPAKLMGINETMPMDKMLEAVGFDRKELENLTQADYDLMLTIMKGIIESKKKS